MVMACYIHVHVYFSNDFLYVKMLQYFLKTFEDLLSYYDLLC